MLAHFEIVPAFTNSRTDVCVDGSCASDRFCPQLAAVLIEKAAELKFQVDESSTMPSTQPPDVQPENERQVPEP
jgi:hypothetical protein